MHRGDKCLGCSGRAGPHELHLRPQGAPARTGVPARCLRSCPWCPRSQGTVMGWGWHDLSRADRLTVAAIDLGWRDLGLGPQRQRIQRRWWWDRCLCTDHRALEARELLQPRMLRWTLTKMGRGMGTRPGAWMVGWRCRTQAWEGPCRATVEKCQHACCLLPRVRARGWKRQGANVNSVCPGVD